MSGGSLDYVYIKVENAAREIRRRGDCIQYRAFADHLELVAKALCHTELVLSGDWSPGDELEAIEAFIKPGDMIWPATQEAIRASRELAKVLDRAGISPEMMEEYNSDIDAAEKA